MNIYKIIIAVFFQVLFICTVIGQIRLPALVSDGMILQRDQEIKIWGWAEPNQDVTIEFLAKKTVTQTNAIGEWQLTMPPHQAGGPFEMTIQSNESVVSLTDIYFGDIWLCAGQSNMELPIRRVEWMYKKEVAQADFPLIRQFKVPQVYDFNEKLDDLKGGNWVACSPETVLDFTAVGFFFAKEIHNQFKIPIGLLNTAVGGSPAQAWIDETSLKQFPIHYQDMVIYQDDAYVDCLIEADRRRQSQWMEQANQRDSAYMSTPWRTDTKQIDQGFSTDIPMNWSDGPLGDINGVVWFKKDFELTEQESMQDALLVLGRVADADSVWVNGTFVGNITYRYPPRRYPVAREILQSGKNTIVVRIINNSGKGGFWPDKDYQLEFEQDTLDLKANWHYRLGTTMLPLASQTFVRWKPIGLYNGMIHPLVNYPIKGVLWYQGESNTGNPGEYSRLMESLITLWRTEWNQPNMPFISTQLANYMEVRDEPYFSRWAWLRDQQLKTLSIPNTAMAVTIDIGEMHDIHPLDKSTVGHRLALAATKIAYGKDIIYSGPSYQSFTTKNDKIHIQFDHVGSGLMAKNGDSLYEFAIAGEDQIFHWAEAQIVGSEVIVTSPAVKNPVAVRYAWADNPSRANLYNKEGLPASPFRTDSWNN